MKIQPSKKDWYKKKRYLVLLFLVAIFVISAVTGNDSQKSVNSSATYQPQISQPKTDNRALNQTTGSIVQPSLSNDNYYKNVDGQTVHSPAYSETIPVGATAKCRDGTYSFSQHRSGTCSHHGGVSQWL